MSCDDTAKITSVCDGNCFSIFLVWRSWGSLLEKKKFSSTTGFRSTKAATSAKSTPVTSNINQCAPNKPCLLTMRQHLPDLAFWPAGLLIGTVTQRIIDYDNSFRSSSLRALTRHRHSICRGRQLQRDEHQR